MPGAPLVELRNVTVRREGQTLLDDVCLTVHEGETVGVIFAHGRGRSTLLRIASGFFAPDSGAVFYRGRRMASLAFRDEIEMQRRIGFIFQNGGLLLNQRVSDNVALPLRYHTELSDEEIEARVRDALELVGMAQYASRFPYELGVAKQKLVTLARALVREPEIILYDNFYQGADLAAWETLTRLVRQLRATRNMAWLLILEADPQIYPIVEQLCIIEDGRVLATSSPTEMASSADLRVSRVTRALDLSDDGERKEAETP